VRTGGADGESPGEAGSERDDVSHKGCFQIEGESVIAYRFVMVMQ
jgi:hypothetical protein